MTVSAKAWDTYIANLRKMSDKAAQLMSKRLAGVDFDALDYDTRQGLIDYAYALATKYGEGAGALASEMYDALAELSDTSVPVALPAQTATYAEVAKAVNGTIKSRNTEIISAAVGRQVKMVGVDTMMQNALRDGAEWAWIPRGDTCAFCIALASRGWQRASKEAIKDGHAEQSTPIAIAPMQSDLATIWTWRAITRRHTTKCITETAKARQMTKSEHCAVGFMRRTLTKSTRRNAPHMQSGKRENLPPPKN